MKALSIRQPWAWLIAAGYKDIENRNWSTGFRGRICIHASSKFDKGGWVAIISGHMNISQGVQDILAHKTRWERGAIIGEVDIVDCVTQSSSPWFIGPYGFVLANPMLYDRPMSCKGKLGLFKPEIVRNQWKTRKDAK